MRLVREFVLLAVAAAFSWWIVFGWTIPAGLAPLVRGGEVPPITVDPRPLAAPVGEVAHVPPAPAPGAPPAATATAEQPEPPHAQTPQAQARQAEPPAATPKAEPSQPEPPQAEPPQAEPPQPETQRPETQKPEPQQPEAVAPARELGSRDGAEDGETSTPPPAALAAAAPAADAAALQSLMQDRTLQEQANHELSGNVRHGFEVVFLASPEDQLDIARFFGEQIVLVPRKRDAKEGAGAPLWYRLDPRTLGVEEVRGDPEHWGPFVRYRDLLAYEYARLPEPLRRMRRLVIVSAEIHVFAAVIPASEWALVIARRSAALAAAGRSLDEVRKFVLRYRRVRDDGFDVEVDSILFTDGRRWQPRADDRAAAHQGGP